MTLSASGSFEVNLVPLTLASEDPEKQRARMSIDKTFTGDLVATSQGEMLIAGTSVKGSAGYVAVERVTGTLGGKSGSFTLLHRGIMNRGAPELRVTIVPDSGLAELAGISGTLDIRIESGKHFYTLDYELPSS